MRNGKRQLSGMINFAVPLIALSQHSSSLPGLLINKRRSIQSHGLHIRLRRHRLPLFPQLTQQLEVINIETRRSRKEQSRFVVRRVGERMWRPDGHGHVVPGVRVDDFLVGSGV